jgi:hypothetical protein
MRGRAEVDGAAARLRDRDGVSVARIPAREEASPARELTLVPAPRRLPVTWLALAGIYAAAFAYHLFQSFGHVTPSVFGDELLYSKLAQSVAAGHGFLLRGEAVDFPARLAVLVQAPAWLASSLASGYVLAKALNVAVMSAAVFPAYALARRLARPSYALLAAAITVAGPVLVYAPYLMSEALAYPVFLLALATMVRAFDRPSRWMEAAVVAVSVAAVLTRVQFVVVPVAYLAVVVLRRGFRRHALSTGGLLALAAVPLLTGGALLGAYGGAATLSFDPVAVLRWSALTAALLPFAAGWLIIPGALLGLALLCVRPRDEADAAFGILAVASIVLVLAEVGLIGAGEAGRSLERYAIYLVPLAAVAFFAYAERGAPWRRAYAGLALAGGATAWLLDFPVRAGTSFSFDTVTYSVYAQTAAWLGEANAATIFAGVPFLGGIVLALLPLRRQVVPGVAAATIALLLVGGAAAYAGDHSMTRGALALRAGDPPDWLDRSGLGSADYLELPGGSAHYGWLLESWNRGVRSPIELGVPSDGYATRHARIDRTGRLLVDGRPERAGTLVVNDYGTALDIDGSVVASPVYGLTAYRVPAGARVRSLATGIGPDRWAEAVVHVKAWPSNRGVFRVVLSLPTSLSARNVTLRSGSESRRVSLGPGESRVVHIPAEGDLEIRTDRADYLGAGTPNARLVAVRIPSVFLVEKRPR